MIILRDKKYSILGNIFKKLNNGESYDIYKYKLRTPVGSSERTYFDSLNPQEKEDFIKKDFKKRNYIVNQHNANNKLIENKNIENQIKSKFPKEFWDFRNSIKKEGLDGSGADLPGDGDEYALVSFEDIKNIKSGLESGKRFPIYRNSAQRGGVDYDPISKKFIDSDTGKVISNLKKHTKDFFINDLSNWEKERYWDDEDNEKVINFLKRAKRL